MRPIILHPRAREAIRRFPRSVSEIRIRGEDGAYRAFYYGAHAEGIIVFHAFVKKTQQTSDSEIELGRKRLKEILDA